MSKLDREDGLNHMADVFETMARSLEPEISKLIDKSRKMQTTEDDLLRFTMFNVEHKRLSHSAMFCRTRYEALQRAKGKSV